MSRPATTQIPREPMQARRRMAVEAETQEYLQKQITSQSAGYFNAAGDAAAKTAGQASGRPQDIRGIYDMSLCLMSPHRSSEDFTRGEISWYIPPFNLNQAINNCTQVQLNQLTIPRTLDNAAIHEQFIGRRVYVEIVQLPNGSGVRASDGTRFHFECDVDYSTSEYVSLTPLNGPIMLRSPIPSLDEITLRFYQRNPYPTYGLRRVPLYNDVLAITLTPGTNPALFTITGGDDVLPIGPPSSAFISPTVEVYPTGFSTNDSTFDILINGPYNNVLSTLPAGPSGQSFQFTMDGVDASLVTTGTLSGSMYIPKNFIEATLRFTCLDVGQTNLITPVHI